MSTAPENIPRDDSPLATDFTDITELFADMRKTAKEHPDWHFMAADDPGEHQLPMRVPRVGWVAYSLDESQDEHAQRDLKQWTIKLSDVKHGDYLKLDDVGMRDALRSAAGRTKLVELIIGRPGDPAGSPLTKAIDATKAAIAAWQEVKAEQKLEQHPWSRHANAGAGKAASLTIKILKTLIDESDNEREAARKRLDKLRSDITHALGVDRKPKATLIIIDHMVKQAGN